MRILKLIVTFFGRLFLSVIFILSAINKIIDWQNTERGLVALFCDWHSYVTTPIWQKFFSLLLPWCPFILVVVTVLELIGGVLVLIGYRARLGAILLLIFFIPITIFFHQFWFLEGQAKEMQYVYFLKNIAIMGGLLYVLAFGAKVENSSKEEIIEEHL